MDDEKPVPEITTAAGTSETPSACDVCGGLTYESRCKVVCRRCGYTRDCSDP